MTEPTPPASHRSRPNIALILLCLLPAAASCAGTISRSTPALNRSTTPDRSLQFASYSYHHGREAVDPAAELVSWFSFRNIANVPITIERIDRTCACMTPEFRHRQTSPDGHDEFVKMTLPATLQPGDAGAMNVLIPTAEQSSGYQEFRLTVHYNDTRAKQETLRIKATLPAPSIHVTPAAVVVSQKTASPVSQSFTITDLRPRPLLVTSVDTTVPWVHARVETETTTKEKTSVAVKIDGSIPPGRHRVIVSALTNDPSHAVVTLPLLIDGPKRKYPVQSKPAGARLFEGTSRKVTLTVPADWNVTHVDTFPEQLSTEWEEQPIEGSQQKAIVLNMQLTGSTPAGINDGLISLHANKASELATYHVDILPSNDTVVGN